MKTMIFTVALLGAFLAQGLANDDINVDNQGNIGGNVHQTVNIDNHDNIANIKEYNPWNSWNTIFDYNRGLFAARLPSKKACVVSKLNKDAYPTLAEFSKVAEQKTPIHSLPSTPLTYSVAKAKVGDVAQYGRHIEGLCRDVPTYMAEESSFYHDECDSSSIITICGISFCF